jgi:hypothetical protein
VLDCANARCAVTDGCGLFLVHKSGLSEHLAHVHLILLSLAAIIQ